MPDSTTKDLGRNDPCHCGSGKKYKRCCLGKDVEAEREARTAAAVEAEVPEADAEAAPDSQKPRRPTDQPWKRKVHNQSSFQRIRTPGRRGDS